MADRTQAVLERTRLRVGEWEMHAVHLGRAAGEHRLPIVLVHGWGVAGRYLLPMGQCLASSFAVHVPDLPGHGLSSKPRRALALSELSDALGAWMEAHDLGRSLLVGQSFGCQIVSDLATRYPERARGVVLIGPTVDARARTLPRQMARLAFAGLWERASLLWIVVDDYRRMGIRRLREELQEMFADAPERRLPRVQAPGLVIRGARDAIAPLAWAQHVAKLLGDARVATIPGGSHAIQVSAPEAVAAEIRRFARELVAVSDRNTDQTELVRDAVPDPS
jgi:pimeloyl-ACP methyl ester carboxylesterase